VVFVHVLENTRKYEIGGEFSEKLVGLGAPTDKNRWRDTRAKSNVNMIPVNHGGCHPCARVNGNRRGI